MVERPEIQDLLNALHKIRGAPPALLAEAMVIRSGTGKLGELGSRRDHAWRERAGDFQALMDWSI